MIRRMDGWMDNSDWTDGQMYGWMAVMGWMEYSDGVMDE